MFRMSKTLDVITLFHKPSLASSKRVETLLKQLSATASETATEDQASDHSSQTHTSRRDPFELEVTEAEPTQDQLKSIFDYLGNGNVSKVVSGATSVSEALKKVKENGDAFQRPVVVDWNQGKAVAGDNESAIMKLLKEPPQS